MEEGPRTLAGCELEVRFDAVDDGGEGVGRRVLRGAVDGDEVETVKSC